jgi:hypothetical protein
MNDATCALSSACPSPGLWKPTIPSISLARSANFPWYSGSFSRSVVIIP